MMILRAPIFLLFLFFTSLANAHTAGESYLFLSSYERSVGAEVQIRLPDVMAILGHPEEMHSIGMRERVEENIEDLKSTVLNGVRISGGGDSYSAVFDKVKIMKTTVGEYLRVNMTFVSTERIPEVLDVDYELVFDEIPDHKALVVIRFTESSGLTNYHSRVSVGFDADNRSRQVDFVSGFTWSVFLDFVGSGGEHIVRGLDHMLFLIALILQSVVTRKSGQWQPVSGFRQGFLNILKIVTLFTLAHSITLSMGVLGYAQVPSRLTEGIIAASVAFVGLNILFPMVRERVWLLVFGFGLFHGLGFASNLDYLDVTKGAVFIPLAGFNLGVEVGQLIIIAFTFPVLYWLSRKRFYCTYILKPGALVVTIVAILWLAERVLDIDGLAPDELPIALYTAK